MIQKYFCQINSVNSYYVEDKRTDVSIKIKLFAQLRWRRGLVVTSPPSPDLGICRS
jgi:hypothetical protein